MRVLMLAVLLVVACGCARENAAVTEPEGAPAARPAAEGKRVVMIVAHEGFRDEELLEPQGMLEAAGVKVTIASSSLTPARGALGATVTPAVLVGDVDPAEYDAVVFVGGPGASEYWDDPEAHALARSTAASGKILAAICIAPVTLANAGVLEGKQATVWSSEAERLRAGGADYTGREVEVDGLVITASGPGAAEEFGRALLSALSR